VAKLIICAGFVILGSLFLKEFMSWRRSVRVRVFSYDKKGGLFKYFKHKKVEENIEVDEKCINKQ